jgi:hypothetical protein
MQPVSTVKVTRARRGRQLRIQDFAKESAVSDVTSPTLSSLSFSAVPSPPCYPEKIFEFYIVVDEFYCNSDQNLVIFIKVS